ncbi:MAG: radical SAM protein [Acidimicrobiia bacterium]|nr:radical SAM protein [Acidimicrobiia bacterium]
MSGIRWPLASDVGNEQELFPQGLRVVGKGEYRGLEFLEVDAKTIINKVPGPPRFGFQYTINAYRGCSHACGYCFARPTHEYLGLNLAEDFDTKIVVKRNAVDRARAETSPAKWGGDLIAMGTNTDPYQAAEGKYRLTRGLLEVMVERGNPVSLLTKSSLVLRDIDVLQDLALRTKVRVDFSVGTIDEAVWKATEPGTPHPMRRIEAVGKLNAAGIRSGVLMGPVLPGISDSPDQLYATLKAAVDAGAVSIGHVPLHLGPGVKEHFVDWIVGHRPDLLPMYEDLYSGKGKQAAVKYRTWLGRTVGDLLWELGGPEPRRPKVPKPAPPKPKPPKTRQMALDLG